MDEQTSITFEQIRDENEKTNIYYNLIHKTIETLQTKRKHVDVYFSINALLLLQLILNKFFYHFKKNK